MSIEDGIKRLKEAHAEHLAGHDDGGREYLAACTPDVVGHLLARVAPRPADPEAIARLREALAAGPSAGPYRTGDSSICREEWTCYSEDGASCWQPVVAHGGKTLLLIVDSSDGASADRPSFDADAALHAACSPEVLAHLLAALDEREALREDAERYRWLRDSPPRHTAVGSLVELWQFSRPTAAAGAIDAAIDAARKEPT